MSRFDYEFSQRAELQVGPFRGLIMAAMRRADTDNLWLLQRSFPQIWDEFQARYRAPGGLLPGEAQDDADKGGSD